MHINISIDESHFEKLVEQDDLRGQALFALGYWAGCHVVNLTYLLMEHTYVVGRTGWLHLGESAGKVRDIDLVNEAQDPLHTYLQKQVMNRACMSSLCNEMHNSPKWASITGSVRSNSKHHQTSKQ